MSKVSIGPHRILQVDGRPFFPIGVRHIPDGSTPALLREAGFNCIRWAPFGWDHGATELAPPPDFGELLFYPYVFVYGDLAADVPGREAALTKLVSMVRDHPRLLCYEQRNEPAYTHRNLSVPKSLPETMAAGSAVIRRLDPDHPIRVGHGVSNLVSTLARYNDAVDIVGCNPYVILQPHTRNHVGYRPDSRYVDSPDQTLSAVGEFTSKMRRVAAGRPVWMQIQASANENWFNEEYSPECRGQGVYEYQKLYPSRWEMRFMAFHAILRGATALEWMMIGLHVESIHWHDVRSVIGELSAMHDVLSAPTADSSLTVEYGELGSSDWNGVETLVKLPQGKPWILAANTQFDPMQARFHGLPVELRGELEVVGENRTVAIRDGWFTDRFQPYEVHIYRGLD